jgi:D-glycero-beta-D-manno-heptose-7-phosphate kinase
MENFQDLFRRFSSLKVGVVGDVMLDTYMWGEVDRISPEAPVPIVSVSSKEQRVGGAGNVALNIQSLGAKAFIISAIGKDDEAVKLTSLFASQNINCNYSIQSHQRITTNKTRIISRNQHMMRLDAEITNDLCTEDEKGIIESFEAFVQNERPDIVVLEDYNKGVLTVGVIHAIVSMCKKAGVITAVDPKRKNFLQYKGVNIFKPNLKEVKEALNLMFNDVNLDFLGEIHAALNDLLRHEISFITLSEKGVFYSEQTRSAIIPSHVRNIADVSGAGDTVIAVASLVYAVTRNVHLMAEVANLAGGLVCEEVGTVAINREKLLNECELLLSR